MCFFILLGHTSTLMNIEWLLTDWPVRARGVDMVSFRESWNWSCKRESSVLWVEKLCFKHTHHPEGIRVMWPLSTKEFTHHRSSSSLVYHINAKHSVVGSTMAHTSSKDANHSKTLCHNKETKKVCGQYILDYSDGFLTC